MRNLRKGKSRADSGGRGGGESKNCLGRQYELDAGTRRRKRGRKKRYVFYINHYH